MLDGFIGLYVGCLFTLLTDGFGCFMGGCDPNLVSYSMGTVEESGWIMKLTTHIHLEMRLRMSVAIPLLPSTCILDADMGLYFILSLEVLQQI